MARQESDAKESVQEDSHFREELIRHIQHGSYAEVEGMLRQFRGQQQATEDLPPGHAAAEIVQPPTPQFPPSLGDFELVREIGRGGMGVVYEARQVSLNKRVALKLLPLVGSLDSRSLTRFQNEAQAAAQLQHPRILPVLAVGADRGVHYYAMQYIDGLNLAEVIFHVQATSRRRGMGETSKAAVDATDGDPAESPGTQTSRPDSDAAASPGFLATLSKSPVTSSPEFIKFFLKTAIQVADALHHAHSMGVVHRDVKPSNLLVDWNGNAWLTDFGLAHVQGNPVITVTGRILGTLRYMSPEQAYAKRVVVDHRTDIYSLGVTLYELLTLQPAVKGHGKPEILRQVAFEDPTPPRKIDRQIPIELETILLKAVSKNPDERYQTAEEMADDLRRVERDEPIQARPPTLVQRASKWARRHKAAVVATEGVVVSLFFATLVTSVLLWNANRRVRVSHQETKAAVVIQTQEKRLAEQRLRVSQGLRLVAHSSLELPHNPSLALALAVEGAQLHRGLEANNALSAALEELREVRTLAKGDVELGHVAFSPNGRFTISTSSTRRFLDKEPAAARIWDVEAGQPRTILDDGSRITSAAFSPLGARVLTASSPPPRQVSHGRSDRTPGAPVLWNWETGRRTVLEGGYLLHAHEDAFNRSGSLVVTPASGNAAVIWDVVEGHQYRRLEGHAKPVLHATFDPSGERVATVSDDNTVRIWKVSNGDVVVLDWWARASPRATRCVITSVAFSVDGSRLVTASDGVHIWNCDTGKRSTERLLPGTFAAFTSNGRHLVTVRESFVEVYDAKSFERVYQFQDENYLEIALSPDGRYVASWSRRGTNVRVWSLADGDMKCELMGHERPVNDVRFDHASQRLATASDDKTARIWNIAAWGELQKFAPVAARRPTPVVSIGNQHFVLATTPNPVAQRYDLNDLTLTSILAGEIGLPQQFGSRVVTVGDNGATLFEASTGKVLRSFAIDRGIPTVAMLSPNGKDAAVIVESELWLWNVDTDQRRRLVEVEPATAVVFEPTGAALAVTTGQRLIRIYDIDRRAVTVELPHEDSIRSVRYNSIGTRLVTVTNRSVGHISTGNRSVAVTGRSAAHIWSLQGPQKLAVLRAAGLDFDRARFSHDASCIITYRKAGGGQVVCWEVATGKLRNRLATPGSGHLEVGPHPAEDKVAIASKRGLEVWDFATGESRQFSSLAASATAFTKDGRRLLALQAVRPALPGTMLAIQAKAYGKPSVRVWDSDTGDLRREVSMRAGDGLDLTVSADGSAFYVNAFDYGVAVCDIDSGKTLASFPVHAAPLTFAGLLPDEKRIVTASWDRTAAVWNASTGAIIHPFGGHSSAISAAALSRDGQFFATADCDGRVFVWDLNTGKRVNSMQPHRDTVLFVRFSDDGERLLTGGLDETIRITRRSGDSEIVPIHGKTPQSAEFALGSDRMLTLVTGKTEIRDDGSGTEVRTRPLPEYRVQMFASKDDNPIAITRKSPFLTASFLGQGEQFLTVSSSFEVEVWRSDSGQLVHALGVGRQAQSAFGYADGTRVVIIGNEQASVWDNQTTEEVMTLRADTSFHASSRVEAVSPNERWLITLSSQGVVRKWPLDPLDEAQRRMPRGLTETESQRFRVRASSL